MQLKYLIRLTMCLTLVTANLNAQQAARAVSDSPLSAAQARNNGQGTALIYKSIIPPKLVDDMFGHRISREYLAIQVTIFNTDEQRNLLVNDISIDYGALIAPQGVCHDDNVPATAMSAAGGIGIIPQKRAQSDLQTAMTTPIDRNSSAVSLICQTSSQELSILRGVAEKGQLQDPRNLWYRGLQAIGTVGGALTGVAGLGPVLPKAVAAFNGPGLSAFTTAFPDFTINQMNRLNDSAYATNTVVPAQRSKVMVGFVPLNLFYDRATMAEFNKDVYSKFQGTSTSGGLKDLKVRVSYNFIIPTDDVPPILTTVSFDAADTNGFLTKTDVHGSVTGRFLDGATVAITGADTLGLSIKLDPQRQSNDNRLFFVIAPAKIVPTGTALSFEISKGKQTTTTSQTVQYTVPAPTLTALSPANGANGADVPITLTGSNFYDLQPTLTFTRAGAPDNSIHFSQLTIVNSGSATATLSLKDATAGRYNVTLSIGSVPSGAQPFEVK